MRFDLTKYPYGKAHSYTALRIHDRERKHQDRARYHFQTPTVAKEFLADQGCDPDRFDWSPIPETEGFYGPSPVAPTPDPAMEESRARVPDLRHRVRETRRCNYREDAEGHYCRKPFRVEPTSEQTLCPGHRLRVEFPGMVGKAQKVAALRDFAPFGTA